MTMTMTMTIIMPIKYIYLDINNCTGIKIILNAI